MPKCLQNKTIYTTFASAIRERVALILLQNSITTKMKSIIFRLAHFLRTFKLSLSQALKMAWAIVTKKPTVSVVFRKEDETERPATATITSVAINKSQELYARFTEVVEGVLQPRSFNFNRLISITL